MTTPIAPDTLRGDPNALIDLKAGGPANIQIPTSLAAAFSILPISTGQVIALLAGGAVRALTVGGTYTIGLAPSGFPFLVFSFTPTIQYTAAAARMGANPIYRVAPAFQVSSGVAIPNLGAGAPAGNVLGLEVIPNYNDIAGGGSAGATAKPGIACVKLLPNVGAGWTLGLLYLGKIFKPTGTGTIDDLVGLDIDDILAAPTVTHTNVPKSVRSLSTGVRMEHAGPIKVGSIGAPNTPSGIDIDGDLSLRSADLALVNGVNNDIAIGNRSFIRITGPTGAFNITSIASPQNGKRLVIVNTTAFAMTITNAAATGTAANRIVTSTLADLVGTATHPTTIELVYDAATARWRDINFRP